LKQDTIIADQSGVRLDKYLADKLDNISRSQIQKYIKSGQILVNSELSTPKYNINANDKILIELPESEVTPDFIEPQNIPLDIIFEDDNIVLVNKPAGLTVHPGIGNRNGTLVNALAYHFNELSDINGNLRPGIVHRLDQNTSGIILVAKNNNSHSKLAEQFSNRTVKKVYYGITWGRWEEKEGIIDKPIGRRRNDPTTYHVDLNGKESRTDYKTIKESEYFTEMNYFPKTGRTHQIRVHSAFIGNPILGDDKYSGSKNRIKGYIPEITKKMETLFRDVKRHILHAAQISFIHPVKNREMQFKADIPEDIIKVQNQIKLLNV